MRILLLNPPRFETTKYGLRTSSAYGPPLGIALIAATLDRAGYDVNAKDLYDVRWDTVKEAINAESPDIVGITTLNQQRESVYQLMRLIKEIDSGNKVVLRGVHSNFMHEQILRETKSDFLTVNPVMVFPGPPLSELAKSQGILDDDYWLTDRPAPFYTAEIPLSRLKFWSDKLMSANSSLITKMLRVVRSYLALWTGLSITRRGIHL